MSRRKLIRSVADFKTANNISLRSGAESYADAPSIGSLDQYIPVDLKRRFDELDRLGQADGCRSNKADWLAVEDAGLLDDRLAREQLIDSKDVGDSVVWQLQLNLFARPVHSHQLSGKNCGRLGASASDREKDAICEREGPATKSVSFWHVSRRGFGYFCVGWMGTTSDGERETVGGASLFS